jgi:hypothetical protein
MKKLKKFLIGLLAVILTLTIIFWGSVKLLISPPKVVKTGSLKELTADEKLEDFRYLYETLKDSYPFFQVGKDKTGFDWLGNKENFERQIAETKNNEEFYQNLKSITMMIQNGHTGVVSPQRYYDTMLPGYDNFFQYPWQQVLTQKGVQEKYKDWNNIVKEPLLVLPVKISYIEGKYVVAEDYNNVKKGYVLEAIEGKRMDEYFRDNMDKFYLNYDDKRNKLYAKASMLEVGKDKDYNLSFSSPEGKRYIEIVKPIKYEQGTSGPLSSSSCEEKILVENKVAYLKVRSMSSRTLKADGKKIREFFHSVKDYPYLVIDIRGNGGGSDYYWRNNIVAPLISEKTSSGVGIAFKGNYTKPFCRGRGIITKKINRLPDKFKNEYSLGMERFINATTSVKPSNSLNYKGKMYLLVDDKVYSSSESFAAFCRGTGFAEIVGTTTGGDGIGIDPCVLALPNSGLVVRFSLNMGINPDGTVNEKDHTKPDIYVETTYEDFINGKDTVLNKVLELCK